MKLPHLIKTICFLGLGFLVALSIVLSPSLTGAIAIQDVPNPRVEYGGWVTDMANIISPATERELNQLIDTLEAETTAEIAIVTVPDTDPFPSVKTFTTELFNTWGIGKKGKDNGILFLTSSGDRRVEIETGYGIEAILPDAQVLDILNRHILPYFKTNDFDTGMLEGTRALIDVLSDETFEGGIIDKDPFF
ncbi:TPM domain-containing protein [Oxynema sp. CENA135]|uniref:TPM domain-containing protein n=1 Tax=Oxynema sp. CENA135 TaxID=984206 RepID=UPI00190AF34A|nr:TPM domain-containing protein [Oxynema sp. CENA135]MBK4729086.1 TPM domain-containing protein [Oxynema sp. CENA135]